MTSSERQVKRAFPAKEVFGTGPDEPRPFGARSPEPREQALSRRVAKCPCTVFCGCDAMSVPVRTTPQLGGKSNNNNTSILQVKTVCAHIFFHRFFYVGLIQFALDALAAMGPAPPNSQGAPLPTNLPFRLISKTIGQGAYAS